MKVRTKMRPMLLALALAAASPIAAYEARVNIDLGRGGLSLPLDGQISSPIYKEKAESLAAMLSRLGGHWSRKEGSERGDAFISILPMEEGDFVPYKNTDPRFGESFRIEIGDAIKIYAGGDAGAGYGIQKLAELTADSLDIQKGVLVDYPDYIWRGAVIRPKNGGCSDPSTISKLEQHSWLGCMKREIDELAKWRLNLVGIISPVFNRMNDDDVLILQELFQYSRKKNMEPMPIIDTKLWGIPITNIDVNAIEGIYHEASYKVEKDLLIAENTEDRRLASWRRDLYQNRLWLDQNKKGARWRVRNPGDGTNGPQRFEIELFKADSPWNNSLLLKGSAANGHVAVQPNTYYEFGLKIRSAGEGRGGVSIGVAQYDRVGSRIKGLNRYPVKIQARNDRYVKNWIPLFSSTETRSVAIRIAPEFLGVASGSIEVTDIELRAMNEKLINVLNNDETSPRILSLGRDHVYEEGVDYEVSYARIKEWRDSGFDEIERTRIRILPNSRIRDGARVLVRYDTLPLQYRSIPRSKYSAVSKYSYNHFARLFRQFDKLAIRFLKVSFSEHFGGLNRDSRGKGLGRSNRNLFVSYINTLEQILREDAPVTTPNGYILNGLGMRHTTLVIWDDMLNPWHNGGDDLYQVASGGEPGATGFELPVSSDVQLSKSVWLSAWWYKEGDIERLVENTPAYYTSERINYFVAAWHQKKGIRNWLNAVNAETTRGLLATTWNGINSGIPSIACAAWNQKEYKNCLRRH